MDNCILKILIVDDDPECLKGYLSALSPLNYICRTEIDPLRALELYKEEFRRNKFDVVVTDMLMPGMNGSELLAALKSFDEDVKVIIITAFEDIDRNRDWDIYAYFRKPLIFRELINTFTQIRKEKI